MNLMITYLAQKIQLSSMKITPLIVICLLMPSLVVLPQVSASVYPIESKAITKVTTSDIDQMIQQPPSVLRYLDVWDPVYGQSVWSFTFDYTHGGSEYLNSFIFDTLVTYDFNTQELTPSLASQWVVTYDCKEWTFSLRKDIFYHDGSRFNASAVKFNYDRFIDPSHPAYAPTHSVYLDMPLESVEILDEFQIKIKFYESFPAFIHTQAPILDIISPNSFEGYNITDPIGTGPYIYDMASSNNTYHKLIRNDDYFRGLAPFEAIDYYLFSSMEDLKMAMANQEGDFVTKAAASNYPGEWEVNESFWHRAQSNIVSYIEMFWFNHQKPELSNVQVRQAINYAIDKELYINESFDGNAIPLASIISPTLPYYSGNVSGFPYNVTKANELLDEAGYPRKTDGYRFDLEIAGWAPTREKQLNIIAPFLDAVGIRCNISYIYDKNEWESMFYGGNFPGIFIVGVGGFFDLSFVRLYLHSEGEVNTGRYSNPEMDDLINAGEQTPVRQEREFYYSQVQQLAQEEAPYLLLREGVRGYFLTSQVIPFISVNRDGRIGLNYTSRSQFAPQFRLQTSSLLKESHDKEFRYVNIEIASKPIYIPFTDTVVTSTSLKPITANITMSHNLKTFLPAQDEKGKFFEVKLDERETEYSLRCYYDLDEIPDQFNPEELALFQWDEKKSHWMKLPIIASNTSLRYLEVELIGENTLLKLTELSTPTTSAPSSSTGINFIGIITYRYFPIFFLIIGGTIGLALITMVINRFMLRTFKERYRL